MYVDDNSLYIDEAMARYYLKVKKKVHGNSKNCKSIRGQKMYDFIDNTERSGGLTAFYKRFPDIHQTIKAIRGVELEGKPKYHAKLWNLIGARYDKYIKHEQTKSKEG